MAVAEEHFIGLDPRPGGLPLAGCPIKNKCAFVVWYEQFGFTYWSAGIFRNTGIGYSRAFIGFDICGNQLPTAADCGFTSFAFGGNRTVLPWEDPTTFDDWLAYAREKAKPYNLPNPGTVQFTDVFHQLAGYRA